MSRNSLKNRVDAILVVYVQLRLLLNLEILFYLRQKKC